MLALLLLLLLHPVTLLLMNDMRMPLLRNLLRPRRNLSISAICIDLRRRQICSRRCVCLSLTRRNMVTLRSVGLTGGRLITLLSLRLLLLHRRRLILVIISHIRRWRTAPCRWNAWRCTGRSLYLLHLRLNGPLHVMLLLSHGRLLHRRRGVSLLLMSRLVHGSQ